MEPELQKWLEMMEKIAASGGDLDKMPDLVPCPLLTDRNEWYLTPIDKSDL